MIQKDSKADAENIIKPDVSTFTKSSFLDWKEAAVKGLKGASYDKRLIRTSLDGISLPAIFTDENSSFAVEGTAQSVCAGRIEKGWRIGQIYQCESPSEFARQTELDAALGNDEVHLVFDSVVATGGDVSSTVDSLDRGVCIRTVDDMTMALPDKMLDFPLQMQCYGAGLAALSLLCARCNRVDRPVSSLRGGIGFSPLSQLVRVGFYPSDVAGLFDEAATLISWVKGNAPDLQVLFIDGTVYQESGGSSAMELAGVLAEAVSYFRGLVDKGVSVDSVASQMVFQLSVGGDFFEDIAKHRALRLLFAGLVNAYGGIASTPLRIRARTSRFSQTIDEPLVNTLRSITASMSGALAGADSIHAAPFDEAWKGGSVFAQRIARNTQVVLQKECQLGEVADPCSGSYYVEHLTNAMAEYAWTLLGRIDDEGGLIAALKSGLIQELVQATFDAQRISLNRRKRKMVGVNDYVAFDEADALLRQSKNTRAESVAKNISAGTSEKSPELTLNTPDIVKKAIAAAEAGATLEQLNTAVKRGPAISVSPLPVHRLAAAYEELRRNVQTLASSLGRPCTVGLLRLGTVRESKARVDFSRSFFNAAGYSIEESPVCADLSAAEAAVKALNADVIVFCSTDEKYAEWAVPLASLLSSATGPTLVLAGRPGELESELQAAGMSEFIFSGANQFDLLLRISERIQRCVTATTNGESA